MTFEEIVKTALDKQNEIKRLDLEIKKLTAEYKHFTKEHLGLADGENNDVVQIAIAIKRMAALG